MAHTSASLMELEERYGAHNYHPLPVVLDRGEGVHVWDVEGKKYYDFLSAYSAVNQGHCHPKIVGALTEQATKLTLTSRAFYNSKLGEYEKYMSETFGFDKILPMNSGAEAVETAIKIARKWGYEKKAWQKTPALSSYVKATSTDVQRPSFLSPTMRMHEPTLAHIPQAYIPYNDIQALNFALMNENVVGFWWNLSKARQE